MNSKFTFQKNLVTENSEVFSSCSNCYQRLKGNELKISTVGLENPCRKEIDDIFIWDAVSFIYGISWEEFSKYLKNERNEIEKNLSNPLSSKSFAMCQSCASLLSENYKWHKKFEEATDSKSIIYLVRNIRGILIDNTENGESTPKCEQWTSFPSTGTEEVENSFEDFYTAADPFVENFHQIKEEPIDDEVKNITFEIEMENRISPFDESNSNSSGILKRYDTHNQPANDERDPNPDPNKRPRRKTAKRKAKDRSSNSKKVHLSRIRNSGIGLKNVEVVDQACDSDSKLDVHQYKIFDESFKTSKEVEKEHMPVHLESLVCPICSRKFTSLNGIKNHMNQYHEKSEQGIIHHTQKGSQRKEKGENVDSNYSEQGDGEHECSTCRRCYRTVHTLKTHLLTHNPDYKRPPLKRHPCHLCDQKLKSVRTLQCHLEFKHGLVQGLYIPCHICDKKVRRFYMKDHMKTHGPREEFKCDKCEKVYLTRENLVQHMKIHEDSFVPYECTICGKTFIEKASLTMHEKRHTGDKKFLCQLCPAKFYEDSSRKVHEFTHTSERSFVCDKCGKAYKTKYLLGLHLKMHKEMAERAGNGAKCDDCGAVFKTSFRLKAHIKHNHLKNRIFQCSFCGKEVGAKAILQRHEYLHRTNPNYQPRKKQEWKNKPNAKLC